MMQIETFVLTAFQQNTRIVSCDETGEAICIDPGEPSAEVAAYVRDNGLTLKAQIMTHGHLDHVGGAHFIREEFPDAEVMVHKEEEDLYYALPQQPLLMGIQPHQLAALGMDYEDPPEVTYNPKHGEVLEIGKLRFEVRHCPGHTLGHIVLVEAKEEKVFTGDCIFHGTVGRTDLPGGNHKTLIDSINAQVMSLPDNYTVCCGHGPDTSIGRERVSNPFLTGLYQIG